MAFDTAEIALFLWHAKSGLHKFSLVRFKPRSSRNYQGQISQSHGSKVTPFPKQIQLYDIWDAVLPLFCPLILLHPRVDRPLQTGTRYSWIASPLTVGLAAAQALFSWKGFSSRFIAVDLSCWLSIQFIYLYLSILFISFYIYSDLFCLFSSSFQFVYSAPTVLPRYFWKAWAGAPCVAARSPEAMSAFQRQHVALRGMPGMNSQALKKLSENRKRNTITAWNCWFCKIWKSVERLANTGSADALCLHFPSEKEQLTLW